MCCIEDIGGSRHVLLSLTVAVCSFVLMILGFVCWLLAVCAEIGGMVLLLTYHPAGGESHS